MDSSSEDLSTDDEEVRKNFEQQAKMVENELLPCTSKNKYIQCWEGFEQWQKDQKTTSVDETRFLVYFKELSLKYCPATLWSKWSMLKSVLRIKKNINLNNYGKLKAFVKQKSRNYRSKQAATFTFDDIKRFCAEAPDVIYLVLKVMAIIGICTAMRCAEFCTLKPEDVVDMNPHNSPDIPNRFIVKVIDAKSKMLREYVIGEPFYNIIEKYVALRPSDAPALNFFLKYQNGKISRQNIGKNTFGSSPKKIAEFLKLPNAERYLGHSWRRSAATFVANAGGTLLDVKHMGGWKSDAVAQRYIDRCEGTQLKLFNMVLNSGAALSETKAKENEESLQGTKRDSPPTKKLKTSNVQDTSVPSTSKCETNSSWLCDEDDEWLNEAADSSIFFNKENCSQKESQQTKMSDHTDDEVKSSRRSTANRNNDRTPLKDSQTDHRNVRQLSMENLLKNPFINKLENCTIHQLTINNYITQKENDTPHHSQM